ncbi:MAG: hypothetical protein KF693_17860 [Nitrospira sp.]|nr:hypothetical protein [Nitrospira sp.]
MKLPGRMYHLAEAPNWPLIQRDGLVSASRLLHVAGLTDADRDRLERAQRLTHTELPGGVHIRDQRPMPPAALTRCLCGMGPADWYALINSRVFFWLDPDRLNRQKAACEPRPQVVIEVDTAALVAAHEQWTAVTPINTGNARRRAACRGAATFVPLVEWIRTGWASEAQALRILRRKRSHQPVELTVLDAVPDILRFVTGIFPLPTGQPFIPDTKRSPPRYTDDLAAPSGLPEF